MSEKVKLIEIVEQVDPARIPNGRYPAYRGGYQVNVIIQGVHYVMTTEYGVRTPSMKCVVIVEDGKITVE